MLESNEMTQDELDAAYDEAYIAACELDSPNSPDFDSVFNDQLIKYGLEFLV